MSPNPLSSQEDRGLDVDAAARGLAEMEQAMAERDRYRAALEHIVASAAHPSPTVNEAGYLAHVAREALSA